ncbi:histidine kinase [Zymoseptoria tritici IPO323]|uniref:histidine kinase n=1 Tax=Zymoseptoria tritici (strain CBS 115943 / IPO323) TaxID=336722 RepID=F9XM35_ZYMTI|nr:histidine kinase [Zymoseptoria tritici IPO323]EGP83517.1 histidine kinase [Zymoseptoria tritici IPO323]
MSSWNDRLRRSVNFLMGDPRASVIMWGPQRTMIYNEHYKCILEKKHPCAMGRSLGEVWPEVPVLADAIARADETGCSSQTDRELHFVERLGYLEEVYGSWTLVAVLCGEQSMFYATIIETTEQVVYERQKDSLLRVEKETADARSEAEYWSGIARGLESNNQDAPWAVVYSSKPARSSSGACTVASHDIDFASREWKLEARLGILDAATPLTIDAEWSAAHFTPSFEAGMTSGEVQLLRLSDGTFAPHLHSVSTSRAYGDCCDSAVLIPVGRLNTGYFSGFLIMGINSRRAYAEPYQAWIKLLLQQLSSSLSSLNVIEEENRRIQRAAEQAALDRTQLTAKLALTEREARNNELRFRTIADHVPVAMYEISVEGDILYANDSYFELLGLDRNNLHPFCWVDTIHESSMETYEAQFEKLTAGESVQYEAMMKKPFIANDVLHGKWIEGETWILMAGYAVRNADGSIKSIQGALIDISRQKWMERSQERRMQELVELKRQQERFMDMVGHEIRNPPSAITLCAESILDSLESALETSNSVITIDRESIESHIENAEVITTCIQHQRRIIDDVLTLSKLDSGLLVIAPCEVQPSHLIEQSLRMFTGEFQESGINLQYNIDQSYYDLDINWVLLDPSRLLQINLNLVTNAIKFTRNEPTRNITVTLAASRTKPTHSPNGTTYLDAAMPDKSTPLASPALTSAELTDSVYLMIAVHDSGIGIPAQELSNIFLRFQQSSPKTHVRYGGSGLGLFISRELARLQGGKIGVASEHGKGSVFEFYVRTKRCAKPEGGKMSFGGPGDAGDGRRTSLRRMVSNYEGKGGRRAGSPKREGGGTGVGQSERKKFHVLLVEDNLVNQKVMAKQLMKAGHVVALANHGREAVEYVQRTKFASGDGAGEELDVVLMDIEMPIMDGLEATRLIRSMESSGALHGTVPVIAVTANARGEQQMTAREAGVNAIVTKPFQMAELMHEIHRVAARCRSSNA